MKKKVERKAGAKLKRIERRCPKPKAEGSSPSVPSISGATMNFDGDYFYLAPAPCWRGGQMFSASPELPGAPDRGRAEFTAIERAPRR